MRERLLVAVTTIVAEGVDCSEDDARGGELRGVDEKTGECVDHWMRHLLRMQSNAENDPGDDINRQILSPKSVH